MEVFYIENLSNLPTLDNNSCCIGVFDGLHNGHRELIKCLKNFNKKTLLITFENRNKTNYFLMNTKQKNGLMEQLGVDYLIIFPYQLIKDVVYQEFVKLLKFLNVKDIICGEDFRYGFNREGDVDYLKNHFTIKVLDYTKLCSNRTSSSLIKELISTGKIKEANEHLGMNYTMCCEIISFVKEKDITILQLNYFKYLLPLTGMYKVTVNYGDMLSAAILKLTESKEMFIYLDSFMFINKDIEISFIREE